MRKVLLPLDGSAHALQAARYLIDFIREHGPIEIHALNVEPRPIEWQTHAMEQEAVRAHLAARAHEAMAGALSLFRDAGILCKEHFLLGDVAETIVAFADELGCDAIVMGTRGLGVISGLALGSVTRKVLHLTRLPVTCVK